MNHVWTRRALRTWLVVLLPLSLFFFYRAIDANLEAQRAQSSADYWYEKYVKQEAQGIPKGYYSADPQVEIRRTYDWKYAALDRRDNSAIWAVALFTIPIPITVGLRLRQWIWGAENSKDTAPDNSDSMVQKSRLSRKKVVRGFGIAVLVASIAAAMLTIAPERALKSLVSSLVQAVGILLLFWLYNKFKRK